MRSLATDEQLTIRRQKELPTAEAPGSEVYIDGFNIIITLEVLMCDSILFSCMDGTIRDLAALRGTYRIIPETHDAIRMLLDVLRDMDIRRACILLDEPVSNSGRLKSLIADIGETYPFDLDIQIIKDVDRALFDREHVITTDSVILDHCKSWLNLTVKCLQQMDRQALCVWTPEMAQSAVAAGSSRGENDVSR
jgi:hypothetical protein